MAKGDEPSVYGGDPWATTGAALPVPDFDAARLDFTPVTWDGRHPPLLLVETNAANGAAADGAASDGEPIRLCDFASAGQTGTLYRSWLPVRNAPERPSFTWENSLRSRRV